MTNNERLKENLNRYRMRGTANGLIYEIGLALKRKRLGPAKADIIEYKRFHTLLYAFPFTFKLDTNCTGLYRVVVTIPIYRINQIFRIRRLVQSVISEHGAAHALGLVSIRFGLKF